MSRRVAVVGAGMSGLICARMLADHGVSVRVFEKSRAVAGRMSTRRSADLAFDHGAQYFTVRDPRFSRQVEAWLEAGVVDRWEGRIAVLGDAAGRSGGPGTERFVGVPGMAAVCEHLADDLDVSLGTRVTSIDATGGVWQLGAAAAGDLGRFDSVIVAIPAPQAADLLAGPAADLAERARAATMAPCWAAMASFPTKLGLPFDAAFVHDSALAWIARNDSKPGRSPAETWVLHGSPGWSRDTLDNTEPRAAEDLLSAFEAVLDRPIPRPNHLVGHRWRFALPTAPLEARCLFDPVRRIGACGDWCGGPRIEGAFLSGIAAAERMLDRG